MRLAPLLLIAACTAAPSGDTAPEDPAGAERFGFPLPERELFYGVIGVDHDPEVHDDPLEAVLCADYLGRAFPHCYDEHDGTDYLLSGGFETMDAGSAEIVAAADGVVVSVEDGNYDRCHAEGTGISCDGHEMIGNHVILEHASGTLSRYWHLQEGSIVVEVGASVRCGDLLGKVGSSGYSSMPHLHFEVVAPDGEVVDPYAGPYSQPETWWDEQGDEDALPGAGCTAR